VADRGNRRIQVFTPDGLAAGNEDDVPMPAVFHPWMGNMPSAGGRAAQNGAPWAICITPQMPAERKYLYTPMRCRAGL